VDAPTPHAAPFAGVLLSDEPVGTAAALDIGGANIKAATSKGFACSRPFALWKDPAALPDALRSVLSALPPHDLLAVTMTGELCDSFATRSNGVRHIVRSVVEAAGPSHPVRVWTLEGRLVSAGEACAAPRTVGAANWLALAAWGARLSGREGLVVDIGSTTTDVVAFRSGAAVPIGFSDTDRLLSGELLYRGVTRTPLAALVDHLPFRGESCPVAAELFATTLDVYLILGDIDEDLACIETADARPASRECARARLARMICADPPDFSPGDARLMAQAAAEAQLAEVTAAIERVAGARSLRRQVAVVSGAGEFLARRALRQSRPSFERVVAVSEHFGREVSLAAPAFALASIAASINAGRP
jgi:hypothetical protein